MYTVTVMGDTRPHRLKLRELRLCWMSRSQHWYGVIDTERLLVLHTLCQHANLTLQAEQVRSPAANWRQRPSYTAPKAEPVGSWRRKERRR